MIPTTYGRIDKSETGDGHGTTLEGGTDLIAKAYQKNHPSQLLCLSHISPPLQMYWRYFIEPPLFGVENPPAPKMSWQAFADGSLTREFEVYLSQRIGFRPTAVRTVNQVQMFCGSNNLQDPTKSVAILQGSWLHATGYLTAFSTPSIGSISNKTQATIERIARLHHQLRSQGKVLLVVVSPTKAETYPEHVPERFHKKRRSVGGKRDYEYFVEELAKLNIPHVDSTQIVQQMRAEGLEPFARGGVHWNYLASMKVWQEVVHCLNKTTNWDLPVPDVLDITYEVARGTDKDLAQFLNVYVPPCDGELVPYPVLQASTAKPGSLKCLFVGTSFTLTLISSMQLARTFDESDFLYYNKRHFTFDESHPPARAGDLSPATDKGQDGDKMGQAQHFSTDASRILVKHVIASVSTGWN
ncbi:MAG: hypothetical protein ABL921_32165 [Pirellula sp.]